MSRLNVKKYRNRRSQTVRCAHAESENGFNVTVQLKASEAATVTLVGRWERSLLLTSRCTRLTANLSTHTRTETHSRVHTYTQAESQSLSLTWATVNQTAHGRDKCSCPHPWDGVSAGLYPLYLPQVFFVFLCRTPRSEETNRPPPPAYPSTPSSPSLMKTSHFTGNKPPRSARGCVRMKRYNCC